MTKNIKDLLSETDFFAGMAPPYLELLAGCGKLVHFKAGEFLTREGDPADSFYLLRKGEVSIESAVPGKVLTVSKAGPNDVVGFSWLFPPFRNAFDARAIDGVNAIHLDGKCLRQKAEDDHQLGYEFMKRFAEIILQRMQATRRQMLDIYHHPAKPTP